VNVTMEGEYYYEIYVIQAFTSSKSQFVDTFSSCDNTTSSFFSTDTVFYPTCHKYNRVL